MNPMLKVAYDYGCQKCLADLGLAKKADWDDTKDQLGDSYYRAKEHLYPLRKALGISNSGDRIMDMLRSNSGVRGALSSLSDADAAASDALRPATDKLRNAWRSTADGFDDLLDKIRNG